MENAKQYFEKHESHDVLYFTSDGLAFFDEQTAMNHAIFLPDKSVTTMSRDEVYAELEKLSEGLNDDDDWLDELEENI